MSDEAGVIVDTDEPLEPGEVKNDRYFSGEVQNPNVGATGLVAPFATPDNKLTEAMLADLMENVFTGRKFKLHLTDPTTGKREEKELGA